jgi:hypothetical protein
MGASASTTLDVDNFSVRELGGNAGLLVNDPTFTVDTPPNYSNYALDFNGTDEHATLPLTTFSTGAFTVSAWVNSDGASDYENIVGGQNNNVSYFAIDSAHKLSFHDYGAGAYRTSNTALTTGKWHHVVLTFDGTSTARFYLDGILDSGDLLWSGTTAQKTCAFNEVGRLTSYYERYFDGGIDELAVWNSELTSAQINDIYNGGVPASLTSLSPVSWWRMGENNAGTGTTITDQGSGTNNLTLVNTPTFIRTTPIEDATYNYRSILFNGSDEYATTSADSTQATKSYSFWAKSDYTLWNGVFDHGDEKMGSFWFGGASTVYPFLGIGANVYRYWEANSAQDDNEWHHWVVYIEHDDIYNCKLYCDGVLQAVQETVLSGPTNAYTTGLRLGRVDSYFFDGSLDEFAIFDGELTPSQIVAIYNNGQPANLGIYSPESWWRMGEGDDAGGTIISDLGFRTGPNLITNGDFSDNSVPDTWNGSAPVNLVGWTSGGAAYTAAAHFVITDGKCRLISDGTNIIINAGTTVVGNTYEYSLEVTDVTTGGLTPIGGGVVLEANITSVGTYTGVFTATATTAMAINRQSGTTDITFGNISVKLVNGNPATLVNDPTWSTDSP